jgi:hypothetical protein
MRSRLCMSKHFGYRGWGGGKRTRSQQHSWLEFHIYAQWVCVCVYCCAMLSSALLWYTTPTLDVCVRVNKMSLARSRIFFIFFLFLLKPPSNQDGGVRRIGGTSTTRKCGLGTCNVRSSSWHSITPESIYVGYTAKCLCELGSFVI